MACNGDAAAGPTARTEQFDLQSTVVHYADAPDRCTISPRDVSEADRVTTWLSADRDAFVSLRETR